jgi:predicted nuclease of predicted toxin-antitoxin system
MPLSPGLTEWLIAKGHDAVHAMNVGLARSPDIEILDFAIKQRRVIITADLDYPRLLALQGGEKVGLILFRGGNYSACEMVERIERMFQMVPIEELTYSIIIIEKKRIRRRRLPL